MIKPNLIVSHDWHIQPSCQRSFRTVRLSGALLDRGLLSRTGVLELDALLVFCLITFASIFARTFRSYRTSPILSSRIRVNFLGSRLTHQWARTAQNSQRTPAKMLVPLGRAKGFPLRVMQSMVLFGLSSAGFPTGGSGLRQTLSTCTQTNQLPTSLNGQAIQPPGGSTAALCNFSRVTHVTQVCKRRQTAPCSRLRLPENNNPAE